MINNVVLIGRLTKNVELRYTTSGTAVATFTLAVNRQFTNAQGEREADFIQCVMWRKAAENFANYTHKGSLVGITGRIQTRNYENNQGNRVYVTEIIVDNFSLLEPKGNTKSDSSFSHMGCRNTQPSENNKTSQASTQSGRNTAASDPFADSSEPIDISDDDLPF